MRRSFSIVRAAVVAGSLGCATAPNLGPAPSPGVKVTLLVFSGRPNPSLTLAPDDTAFVGPVRAALNAAAPNPGFKGATVIPSRLGYCGLVLTSAGVEGLPARLAVYGRDLEVSTEGTPQFLKDDSGALEAFLLEQAVQRGLIGREDLDRLRRP